MARNLTGSRPDYLRFCLSKKERILANGGGPKIEKPTIKAARSARRIKKKTAARLKRKRGN